MTIVLLVAGLAFAVGLLVLRPFAVAGPAGPAVRPAGRVPGPADDQRRELLRQLRDLDDDLAAGKLSGDDHERLRRPVERAAAAVLTSAAKASTAKGTIRRTGREGHHRAGRPWLSPRRPSRPRTPAAPEQWGAGAAGAPSC